MGGWGTGEGRRRHGRGWPDVLRSGGGGARGVVCGFRGVGTEGHLECGRFREILERPYYRRIRNGHLGVEAMPGVVETHPGAGISPLAGKPAPRELLVDLARLEREYFERRPDVSDHNQLVS